MAACSRCGQDAPYRRRSMCRSCYDLRKVRDTAYGRWRSGLVSADPVREHVAAVHATGVSYRRISVLSGVSRTTIGYLFYGRPGSGAPEQVSQRTADRLLAVAVPETPMKVAGRSDRMPAVGSVRRLRALVAAGWTQTYLAGRLGISTGNMHPLIHGHRQYLTARRVRQVLELWAELQMVPGPSNAARRYAVDMRWPLPMQWEEESIDDPVARPLSGVRRPGFRGRRVA